MSEDAWESGNDSSAAVEGWGGNNSYSGGEWRQSNQGYDNGQRRGYGGGGRNFQRGGRFGGGRDNGFDDRRRGDFNRMDNAEKSTFNIPSSEVGRVIGRGGSTIKDLQHKSGARIKVNSKRDSYESETPVDVFGTEEQRNKAMELINGIVDGSSQEPRQYRSFDSNSRHDRHD